MLNKFNGKNTPFEEADFANIAELGFDFVRLPMDYRMWIVDGDRTKFNEAVLKEIDDAVKYGQKHAVHVNISFHRAPGYTVAQPPEKLDLWSDAEAQRVCALHWAHFAKRYAGIPNRNVSFNLFNEPARVKPEAHKAVVTKMVKAIRAEDPKRLIICDGRMWARVPPEELLGLGVAASAHMYDPMHLTHYKASWVHGAKDWEKPSYPLSIGNGRFVDKEWLKRHCVDPWKKLEAKGMGVHIGEWGAFNQTPHDVVLAWMRDNLDLWKQAGWGWALWNFRGPFGVCDSGRADVKYETWQGMQLDRAMLEVLQNG